MKGGIIAGAFLLLSIMLQFHNNDVARKKSAEGAIIDDLKSMNVNLNFRQVKCSNKKYADLEGIHLEIIGLEFKLIADTDNYRITFGKKARPEVVTLSTKAVQFFQSQESLIESCSPLSLTNLDTNIFSNDIRNPLERILLSESKDLD